MANLRGIASQINRIAVYSISIILSHSVRFFYCSQKKHQNFSIRGAADCLKAAFGEYGDIYRIGGDEFAAILNLTEAQHTEAMAALDLTSEQWHSQQLEGLSISCGWASSREFPSENIAEIMEISDKRMYAAKEAYYKETGKDRRRS